MADIKVAGSLIPTGVNTPLDKRSRVATLAEIANLGNPVLGAIFYCEEDHKHYKITRLKSKTIGPAVVENAAVDSYEEFGGNPEEIAGINASLEELRSSLAGKADASAVSALDVRVQTGEKMLGAVTENQSIELGFDNVPKTTTADQTDESGNVIYEEDGTTAKTETQRAFRCLVFGDENTYGDSISIFGNGQRAGFCAYLGEQQQDVPEPDGFRGQQRIHGVGAGNRVRFREQGRREECGRFVCFRGHEQHRRAEHMDGGIPDCQRGERRGGVRTAVHIGGFAGERIRVCHRGRGSIAGAPGVPGDRESAV